MWSELEDSEHGHCVLSRTPGMVKLEEKWSGRALMATVGGSRPPVSPEMVVGAVVEQCGVNHRNVKVEVCAPPFDFFVRFRCSEDCTRILHASPGLVVNGETLTMSRWHHGHGGRPSELPYLTKLRFERFPREVWEPQAVNQFINRLGGQLVEMLKPEDSWYLRVMAWMKNPSEVPPVYDVEVPEPELPPSEFDAPYSTTTKPSLVHTILIHVEQVVDPGPFFRTGGHCFGGPSGMGSAGGEDI